MLTTNKYLYPQSRLAGWLLINFFKKMPQWWWLMMAYGFVSLVWLKYMHVWTHTHTFNFLSYYKTFPVRSSIYIPTRNLSEFRFTVYSQIYRSNPPPPLLRLVLFMESWDLFCRQGWLPACESSCLCLLRTKSIIQDMCSGKLRTSCMLSAHYHWVCPQPHLSFGACASFVKP